MAEDFKIIIDIENPLFNRREIEGEIHADVTPNRNEVVKIISEKFSASPETIKVRTIKGRFGSKVFIIVANIYASKEDKEQTELKSKRDAKQEIKPETLTEAPAETPATEEAPKKEEPKDEQEIKEEKQDEESKPKSLRDTQGGHENLQAGESGEPEVKEAPKVEEIKSEEKTE